MKTVLSPEQIAELVRRLAREINEYYQLEAGAQTESEPILVVGILNGAFIFMADLVRELTVPVEIEFIRTSSYGSSYTSSGSVKLLAEPVVSPRNRRVLIIDDMIDTGRTLAFARDYFLEKGAKEVELAVLLDKRARRETEIFCRFAGAEVENYFLGGYGLDGGRFFAQCPYIFSTELQ